MGTKRDRLKVTLLDVERRWAVEAPQLHRKHESFWSLRVIEPVLAALDWPRLLQGDLSGTGAYFEWTGRRVGKHGVDIALLHTGVPRGFLELKDLRAGAEEHVARQLRRTDRDRLRVPGMVAVAGWFEPLSSAIVYDVDEDASPVARGSATFRDVESAVDLLAPIAAAVLAGHGAQPTTWLNSFEADTTAVPPRCDSRDILRRLLESLETNLRCDQKLVPRHRRFSPDPPTASIAYVDLPGILSYGLAFHVDTTTNRAQCLFYPDNNTHDRVDRIGHFSFDGRTDHSAWINEFVCSRVIPEVNRRKALESAAIDSI